jgi:hypothetical protein
VSESYDAHALFICAEVSQPFRSALSFRAKRFRAFFRAKRFRAFFRAKRFRAFNADVL